MSEIDTPSPAVLFTAPYGAKPWLMLGISAFIACLATLLLLWAKQHGGFYWVCFALSAFYLPFGLASVVGGWLRREHVVLTSSELKAPRLGFSEEETTVALSEITAVGVDTFNGLEFIVVDHKRGKLAIPRAFMPNGQSFLELHAALNRSFQRAVV